MAKETVEIVQVLLKTAKKIMESNDYQWGHMGSCNCGFLAQEISYLRKDEIHNRAMERHGDWNEQLNDYCPVSGLLMDDLISEMLAFGFDIDDLKHLEKLSDGKVVRSLPIEQRNLKHNNKHDVVKYLQAWAAMIEEKVIGEIQIPTTEIESIFTESI
jgi:hypothetical protein